MKYLDDSGWTASGCGEDFGNFLFCNLNESLNDDWIELTAATGVQSTDSFLVR